MDNTFGVNIIPENDQERIAVLKRYKILNTPPEHAFDHVAQLAARIFQVPVSLISLVDAEKVFFKANIGMGTAKSADRGTSLCALAILHPEVTVFEDALQPPCLLANPLVAGDFGLKFYAGAPLTTHDGFLIGTLCIIDKKTRSFSKQDEEILKDLAKIVMDEIELRLSAISETEEQAANKKALQKAEEMLRFSIEAANVGTWYFDIRTETFKPSSTLKKLFGYAADEEMTYQHILAQINEDYRSKVIAAASGTIYKGANYSVEFPATGFHDQKVRWLKAIGKLDHDAAGQLSHFSGVVIEITEQKQDEIRKNDFIAMVSHELKTPLTSLKGYMQLLTGKAKKTDDAFTINALERGNTQITKMTAMINGFLNVSRLEAGKIHLEKLPFRLGELMSDIVDEVMMTTQSHDIVLLPVPVLTVNADADKIGQVISNFLSNAVKYSPLRSRIEVAAVVTGNRVQISVKDQGMGISAEDTGKLFDRFYRVENSHAQNISGFGIGLYLCAEIVYRHDGKIWVESETGKGSAFYFSIPNYTLT